MTQIEPVSNGLNPAPPGRGRIIAQVGGLARRRGTAVLADQAVVSLGNFLTLALLGRHLAPAEFGGYGVLTETLFFLLALQGAMVIYPLTIRGASGGHHNLSRLTTASLAFTLFLSPILGGAMAVSTVLADQVYAIVSVTAALALWQCQETLRRALMAELRFGSAIWGDAVRYLGQAGAIFALAKLGWLNLNTAFAAIAVTSLLAAGLQAVQVGLVRIGVRDLLDLAPEFWRLGRWMVLAGSTGLVTTLGYLWTLRFAHGLETVAAFTAIVGMMKLANPVVSSTSSLVLPSVARSYHDHGFGAARRIAVRYGVGGALLLTPFFAFLLVLPTRSLRLMYGEQYMELGGLLRLFVANYALVYLSTWVGAWVNGLGESRANFYAQVANTAVTLAVGLPLTWWLGPLGVILGGLVSTGAGVAACVVLLRRLAKSSTVAAPAPRDVDSGA